MGRSELAAAAVDILRTCVFGRGPDGATAAIRNAAQCGRRVKAPVALPRETWRALLEHLQDGKSCYREQKMVFLLLCDIMEVMAIIPEKYFPLSGSVIPSRKKVKVFFPYRFDDILH